MTDEETCVLDWKGLLETSSPTPPYTQSISKNMNTHLSYKTKQPTPDSDTIQSIFPYLSGGFSQTNSPQYSQTHFPIGTYLSQSDAKTDLDNLIRYKFDNSYYHVLREIDWNVFLTLKFRKRGFTGLSNSASWKRKHYLWDLGHEVIGDLDLSTNDLQYFWCEEVNSEKQAHLHVLFHMVYSEKCSVDQLRASIEKYIDPQIVQIPRRRAEQEPPHVQTVRSQERVVRYALKVPLFQDEPKVVGHSFGFVRFWKRHWNWKRKQAA